MVSPLIMQTEDHNIGRFKACENSAMAASGGIDCRRKLKGWGQTGSAAIGLPQESGAIRLSGGPAIVF